jgi:hypothetical protein
MSGRFNFYPGFYLYRSQQVSKTLTIVSREVLHGSGFHSGRQKRYPVIFRKSNFLGEKTKSIFEKWEQHFLKKFALPVYRA